MSMLAERKQKQKWTLNPRGKYWSDDNNKFGQRMLEKMGWSAGKGLGAKEDGRTEHIKQSYKNDNKGVGFEDKEDQWTQHESDFSTLLQNLGNSNETEVKKPEVSLEIKSQSSRKRVHYHKFTRGKDLSRYSEKDLANIFGRKTLEKQQNIDSAHEDSSNSNLAESKEFGVITVNSGNMTEYFKTKLKTVISKASNEDQSDDERPGFGFSQPTAFSSEPKENNTFTTKFMNMFTKSTNHSSETDKTTQVKRENNIEDVQNLSKERKKKKNKTKVVINECFDNHGFADFQDTKTKNKDEVQNLCETGLQNDGFEDFSPEPIKKSKKRKLETIVEETTIIEDSTNRAQKTKENYEETYTPAKKKSKNQKTKETNDVQTDTQEFKKKSKNKKKGIDNVACTELAEENIAFEVKEDSDLQCSVESNKKIKSKNKKKGIDNVACTELGEENPSLQDSYEKKSKKKKNSASGICNSACDVDVDKENDLIKEENSTKKKKKRTSETGIYNVACTEDNKIDLQDPVEKSGKKKQKNNEDLGISNPGCTENSNESIILDESESSIPSSTKKSKKKKNKDTGVDNLACTANSMQQNLEEAISSMSNAIDDYQLELENQMNEKKATKKKQEFIPKFKSNRNFDSVRKSVKTVIKGDLRYEFEGSNLPQIPGYGVHR